MSNPWTLRKLRRADPIDKKDVVLTVRSVRKKFCRSTKRSMWYGMLDLAKNFFGLRIDTEKLRTDEFWAVKDVSLELRRGEIMGIIGVNGSGKSTLLRLMAGILPPDSGEIRVKGRVASLISLGVGFHPLMTGRENIYLTGSMMKMTRQEIDRKIASIIEFSGLGDFINMPVGKYSSGMRVRLGFSIAMAVEPDILLLDEVLAVGDRHFKGKCYKKIDEMSRKCAIILVSQSALKIGRTATRIFILNKGECVFSGDDVTAGIDFYYASVSTDDDRSVSGTDRAVIHSADFVRGDGALHRDGTYEVPYLSDITVEVCLSIHPDIEEADVEILFSDHEFNNISTCKSRVCDFEIRNRTEAIRLRVRFPRIQLSPKLYFVTVIVKDEQGEILTRHYGINRFKVTGSFVTMAPLHLDAEWSSV